MKSDSWMRELSISIFNEGINQTNKQKRKGRERPERKQTLSVLRGGRLERVVTQRGKI